MLSLCLLKELNQQIELNAALYHLLVLNDLQAVPSEC